MWQNYHSVITVDEVLRILAEHGSTARIIAGGTDLLLELERGIRTGIDTLVDITRVPGLDSISMTGDGIIHLGPLVTHNDCAASQIIQQFGFPLAQAAWEVGAPQIRNRGTVAGNLITASPANDTITPLMALNARVILKSTRGERTVLLRDFYTGVRKTLMADDEMLVDISFPALKENQVGRFIKLGLRRAQAISVVNAAVRITFDGVDSDHIVKEAVVALGAVAPTIIFSESAQTFLHSLKLDEDTISKAAELAMRDAHPIDDLRSSAAYRAEMVRVCVSRCLHEILDGSVGIAVPQNPVLLEISGHQKAPAGLSQNIEHDDGIPIQTCINGVEYRFTTGHQKTLLRLLREEAGLIGTKEGCAEGECGACTVFLDGQAVMSCLVPAVRAHGAEITTIEGVADEDTLHPVQQAFIESGAVQCGYCTPGFIMSGVMLLNEKPHPTTDEIKTAITGNLCRCTGYYKIVEAIEKASQA